MRIICACTTNWNSAEHAQQIAPAILKWCDNCDKLFLPQAKWLCCGSYSNPEWNPSNGRAETVNSGALSTRPYDVFFWHYALCAYSAGGWKANFTPDWDLLVWLELDVLIGTNDFDYLLREFLRRPNFVLTPAWYTLPDGSFFVWKHEAVERYCHHRRRANIVDDGLPRPMIGEEEWLHIFQSKWWNPWPDIPSVRWSGGCDYMKMPFVQRYPQEIVQEYEAAAQPKPVLANSN